MYNKTLGLTVPQGATVALRFDVSDYTTYCNVDPILQEYGLTAGMALMPNGYLIGNRADGCDVDGRISWETLLAMAQSGRWELATHGIIHKYPLYHPNTPAGAAANDWLTGEYDENINFPYRLLDDQVAGGEYEPASLAYHIITPKQRIDTALQALEPGADYVKGCIIAYNLISWQAVLLMKKAGYTYAQAALSIASSPFLTSTSDHWLGQSGMYPDQLPSARVTAPSRTDGGIHIPLDMKFPGNYAIGGSIELETVKSDTNYQSWATVQLVLNEYLRRNPVYVSQTLHSVHDMTDAELLALHTATPTAHGTWSTTERLRDFIEYCIDNGIRIVPPSQLSEWMQKPAKDENKHVGINALHNGHLRYKWDYASSVYSSGVAYSRENWYKSSPHGGGGQFLEDTNGDGYVTDATNSQVIPVPNSSLDGKPVTIVTVCAENKIWYASCMSKNNMCTRHGGKYSLRFKARRGYGNQYGDVPYTTFGIGVEVYPIGLSQLAVDGEWGVAATHPHPYLLKNNLSVATLSASATNQGKVWGTDWIDINMDVTIPRTFAGVRIYLRTEKETAAWGYHYICDLQLIRLPDI